MADPAGLVAPRSAAGMLALLLVVGVALTLTVGDSQRGAADGAGMAQSVAVCEGVGAPVPVLCAAMMQRGWAMLTPP